MKSKTLEKLRIRINLERRKWTKRNVLEKTQHYGLTSLGWLLRGLVRVFYGKNSGLNFKSTSVVQWSMPSFKYYISPDFISGVDEALKANLSPSDALDKLAREAGIPEDVIKGTYKI